MFGSCDRLQRRVTTAHVAVIFLLLSSIPSSSLFGQRFTEFAFRAIGRQSHLFSRSWWAASSLRTHRLKASLVNSLDAAQNDDDFAPTKDQMSQRPLPHFQTKLAHERAFKAISENR